MYFHRNCLKRFQRKSWRNCESISKAIGQIQTKKETLLKNISKELLKKFPDISISSRRNFLRNSNKICRRSFGKNSQNNCLGNVHMCKGISDTIQEKNDAREILKTIIGRIIKEISQEISERTPERITERISKALPKEFLKNCRKNENRRKVITKEVSKRFYWEIFKDTFKHCNCHRYSERTVAWIPKIITKELLKTTGKRILIKITAGRQKNCRKSFKRNCQKEQIIEGIPKDMHNENSQKIFRINSREMHNGLPKTFPNKFRKRCWRFLLK